MKKIKEQYEYIASKREKIIEEINRLEENEAVMRYFELCSENEDLEYKQKELYKKMKYKEYSSCNHLWITILQEYNVLRHHPSYYYGCIKCGLNEKVLYLMHTYYDTPDELEFDDRIMYDHFRNNYNNYGVSVNLYCDLDLAKAIYSKIKEAHPNIDDKTAIEYLKVSLYFIRKIEVNDKRKESRAKRLSLAPKFNNWTGCNNF